MPIAPPLSTVGVRDPSLLDRAIARARGRLVPFLLLMYVLAFLDRANIGFAKAALQADTQISDAAYALGAGLFFLTYAALEVPSNLIMHRVGAHVWMARIMVTWGLISASSFLIRDETSFYIVRLLLGAAEAGFFPGVILYLTYWFPDRVRGQIMGLFYFGAPLAFIFGGPISGALVEIGGLGLHGWQWMFIIEGLAASAVGVWAFLYLDDRPADARWLPEEERRALAACVDEEGQRRVAASTQRFFDWARDPRMLLFVAIYFLIQMSVYGVTFYLPTQVAALLGAKVGLMVGVITAVPWLCALIATFAVPRWADATGLHRLLAAACLAVAAAGIAASAVTGPAVALLALCFAAAGFIAVQPLFWTFPTRYLGGVAAASGLAFINAMGALGGFMAPNAKAYADSHWAAPNAGLLLLAGATVLAAALALLLKHKD